MSFTKGLFVTNIVLVAIVAFTGFATFNGGTKVERDLSNIGPSGQWSL